MQKNAKQKRNVRNLAAVTTLTAIILIVSTYAWFIGLDEVRVENFTVTIAATDSLELSLDGANWTDEIDIDPLTIESIYTGNTNSWTGTDKDGNVVGLIPMSSVGEMDATASRMMMYEKASLTTDQYGIRLMASRVENTGADEVAGYIAFDLFIKNYTGAQYIPTVNTADEEAIYLLDNSTVDVSLTGAADATEEALREASGIENSVRVAFAQIGRVEGTTTDVDAITGITCTDDAASAVTGICRTATIWEPNDTAHAKGAVDYYNLNCSLRGDAANVTTANGNGCETVADGEFVPTYAVNTYFGSDADVNIYDGGYNGLEVINVPAADADGTAYPNAGIATLAAVDTFTDTEKLLTDGDRPELMTLAPNSITKVRVYVYLEGQDIDNYDWAIDGKQIAVEFGFSKQIYRTAP